MEYYKSIYVSLIVIVFGLSGCSGDDDNADDVLRIEVTDFQTSYDEVMLKWELNVPAGTIVENLKIYRTDGNDSGLGSQPLVVNLPSTETSYTDSNVPYESYITYKIVLNYSIVNDTIGAMVLESDPQIYSRNIVLFDHVPFQVQKDPSAPGIYHMMTNLQGAAIRRYDSFSGTLNTRTFDEPWISFNKLSFNSNNEIFIASTTGRIFKFNPVTYANINLYNATGTDDLNAFAVDGDRVYYQDDQVLKFHTMSTNTTSQTYNANTFSSIELLQDHKFLFLYANYGGSGLAIKQILPENCVQGNCSMIQIAQSPYTSQQHNLDPYIFTWDNTKQHFVSSFNGVVYNISSLQQEVRLRDVTGKRYLQFAYDGSGNLYGSVQNEKIIHKFNSAYELIETIPTKLYPVYPLITDSGLQVLGSYQPIDYWGYYYGYEFSFAGKCAIETF